jgi:hypothetical protein
MKYEDAFAVQLLRQDDQAMPAFVRNVLSLQLQQAARANSLSLLRILQDESPAVFDVAVQIIAEAPAAYRWLMNHASVHTRARLLQHLSPEGAAALGLPHRDTPPNSQ